MTMYYSMTIINNDKSHSEYHLDDRDNITSVDGGYEITFHSSPATTTFYPYHRIWEHKVIDTTKLPPAVNDDGSLDEDSTML